MRDNQCLKLLTIAGLTLGIVGTSAPDALARMRHRFPVRHHPYYGRRVSLPELIAQSIIVGGLEYYYQHGYFYQRTPDGYVIIDSPVGAVIETIPDNYKIVVINGKTYYYHNDTYFIYSGKKYVVVADPVYQVAELPQEVRVIDYTETVVKQSSETAENKENEFTVNILNDKGSYTAVRIVRSKEGFVGPQGEYYTEFPKVEQLKVMYGE